MVTEQKELWPITPLTWCTFGNLLCSWTDLFVLWETVGGTCSTAGLHGHQTMKANFTRSRECGNSCCLSMMKERVIVARRVYLSRLKTEEQRLAAFISVFEYSACWVRPMVPKNHEVTYEVSQHRKPLGKTSSTTYWSSGSLSKLAFNASFVLYF